MLSFKFGRGLLFDTPVLSKYPRASLAQIKKRNNIMQEDKDIRDIRAGLALREELVKDAETRTRGQHDYRFVLQYFSASRDLHRTLVANVNYLANEVEQLRANMDHNSESIAIMEQQFVELEVCPKTTHPLLNPARSLRASVTTFFRIFDNSSAPPLTHIQFRQHRTPVMRDFFLLVSLPTLAGCLLLDRPSTIEWSEAWSIAVHSR